MIKVLWLEDEINKIEAFLDRTQINGIEITHRGTANNFIAELNSNADMYDGVILDVMGVLDSLDEKPSSRAFKAAYEAVLALRPKKYFPLFVLSAQLTKDENQGLKEYIGESHIYVKSKDEERLIENIKKSVVELPDYIFRKKYANVLSVFKDKHLGEKHYDRIFKLIKWIESSKDIDDTEDELTKIRKILEAIFHSLSKHGLVPSEITSAKGWLNGTSLFLSNKHYRYIQLQPYIHPTVSDSIFRLLNIIQDGSHVEGELKLRVDEHIQLNQCDYLFKSCTLLLFDIIIWYKKICQSFPDVATNKTLWKVMEQMALTQDSSGNYHCGDVLLTYKEVDKKKYKVGDMIIIIETAENTNYKTNYYYKIKAIKTEKA